MNDFDPKQAGHDQREVSPPEIADPSHASQPPPRVWPVFVTVLLALMLAILFQAVLGGVLAVYEMSKGADPAELAQTITAKLADPYMFMLMASLGQIAFALAGFLPASLSSVPFRERVGLRRPRPSWHVYPLAMLGSIFPLVIGLTSAVGVAKLIPADESLSKMFEAFTPMSALLFVVFIGLVPGIVEEVLFRGYMQQRLMKRWGPIKAIVVTSILFTLVHVTPHALAAVLPLAFWFGYIAWKSNSILPTIACHIFVNSGLNAWRVIGMMGELSESTQNIVHAIAFVIGLACFVICCRPSFWSSPPDPTQEEDLAIVA